MDHKLSIHVKNFNDRVRVMNSSQSPTLVMTAQDARNLHADIFAILAQFAELSEKLQSSPENEVVQINMDGGGFK